MMAAFQATANCISEEYIEIFLLNCRTVSSQFVLGSFMIKMRYVWSSPNAQLNRECSSVTRGFKGILNVVVFKNMCCFLPVCMQTYKILRYKYSKDVYKKEKLHTSIESVSDSE